MALVDGSALVTNVAGKAGDYIFSRNRAGAYVRPNSPVTYPGTAAQGQATARLTFTKTLWQNLTDQQRSDWNDAAASEMWLQVNRFGREYNCSGYQLFMKLGISLVTLGISPSNVPERQEFPIVTPTGFTTSPASPTHDSAITFSASSFSTDFRLRLKATASHPSGITKSKPQFFRNINWYNSGDLSPNLNYKWSWAGAWGNNAAPVHIWIKLEMLSIISGEVIEVGFLQNF